MNSSDKTPGRQGKSPGRRGSLSWKMGKSWPGKGRGSRAPRAWTARAKAWVACTRVGENGWSGGSEGDRAATESDPRPVTTPL